MATLVIDANVLVEACLAPSGFEPLSQHQLMGPPHLHAEALSALHELLFRGEISETLASIALDNFDRSPCEIQRPPELARTAWRISGQLGWTKTYDAEYVALAQLLGCPLVTIDSRLARGAGRLVQVLSPREVQI